jgi:hypothetical protein
MKRRAARGGFNACARSRETRTKARNLTVRVHEKFNHIMRRIEHSIAFEPLASNAGTHCACLARPRSSRSREAASARGRRSPLPPSRSLSFSLSLYLSVSLRLANYTPIPGRWRTPGFARLYRGAEAPITATSARLGNRRGCAINKGALKSGLKNK